MDTTVGFKKNVEKKGGIYTYLKGINEYKEPALKRGDLMGKILSELQDTYWKDVIRKYLPDDKPYTTNQYKIVRFSTRGDYVNLLKTDRENTVTLDIGSGWGQALDALSRASKEVWALEGTYERLEFIKERTRQDKLNNVNLINTSVTDMPFDDESFDVLTMMGVLEWVPVSDLTKDPRKIQIEALKECMRVMKPGGQICIGIENSHGLKYMYGEPDDHTGIEHITYLSREEASAKLRTVRDEDYRTYTYDMDGYTALFKDAGFDPSKIKFYYPIPNYKIYSCIVPVNNIERIKFIYKNLRLNLSESEIDKKVIKEELDLLEKNKISLLKNRVSSYLIVAEK